MSEVVSLSLFYSFYHFSVIIPPCFDPPYNQLDSALCPFDQYFFTVMNCTVKCLKMNNTNKMGATFYFIIYSVLKQYCSIANQYEHHMVYI